MNQKMFKCEYKDCDYETNRKSNLKQHLSFKHDIDVTWYYCTEDDCDYKTKQKGSLKTHLSDKHDIDVTWYYCTEDDCDYKTKQKGSLKTHLSHIHDIDVIWYYCTEDDCDYKTKRKGHLKRHSKTCTGSSKLTHPEQLCANTIEDLELDYKVQHRFDDCRHKKTLPFDFYIPDLHACIEYDGIFHYKPIHGIANFKQGQVRDKIKTQYCIDNNIELLRIHYLDKDKISDLILEFVDNIIN